MSGVAAWYLIVKTGTIPNCNKQEQYLIKMSQTGTVPNNNMDWNRT
jgi:hypothetical protein